MTWPRQAATHQGRAREMLNLPNKASFLSRKRLWISLMDNVFEAQVCHLVTWLRLGGGTQFGVAGRG